MDTISKIIRNIITEIKPGYFFDAHFVISKLIEEHSDEYLKGYTEGTTASYHGRLAQMIKGFEGELVEQQDGMSWSKNINNNYSECSLWKRV